MVFRFLDKRLDFLPPFRKRAVRVVLGIVAVVAELNEIEQIGVGLFQRLTELAELRLSLLNVRHEYNLLSPKPRSKRKANRP